MRNSDGGAESAFCPLDLFSGDENRMSKAFTGLWETWEQSEGKGNNWRVYVDGKAIFSQDVSYIQF